MSVAKYSDWTVCWRLAAESKHGYKLSDGSEGGNWRKHLRPDPEGGRDNSFQSVGCQQTKCVRRSRSARWEPNNCTRDVGARGRLCPIAKGQGAVCRRAPVRSIFNRQRAHCEQENGQPRNAIGTVVSLAGARIVAWISRFVLASCVNALQPRSRDLSRSRFSRIDLPLASGSGICTPKRCH